MSLFRSFLSVDDARRSHVSRRWRCPVYCCIEQRRFPAPCRDYPFIAKMLHKGHGVPRASRSPPRRGITQQPGRGYLAVSFCSTTPANPGAPRSTERLGCVPAGHPPSQGPTSLPGGPAHEQGSPCSQNTRLRWLFGVQSSFLVYTPI